MKTRLIPNLKVGFISGGQLGKMLIQEASKWDIKTYVMDKVENCPAQSIATKFVKGSNTDFDDVYNFGKQVDLLSFEIENVNIEALEKLEAEGLTILPAPSILALIQDKGVQKEFYQKNGIPTSPFNLYESKEAILQAIDKQDIVFPFVQKLRKGGYDGRGVAVINTKSDLSKLLEGASVVEQKVKIDKEISVIVARNEKGETNTFPIVEMVFDPVANLVDMLICPSAISQQQTQEATQLATKIITDLDMVGILAIEFFIDEKEAIIVNEMACRTHNSGHHTIESIITSQFEQHLRAILNLPLGSTQLKMPAVMLNLLGAPNHTGKAVYYGLAEAMAIEGVKIHLYGKEITKPYRKMGHITILAYTLEKALKKAEKVKALISVRT